MKFKLNPYIASTYLLPAVQLQPNGSRKRVRYSIEPDKIYDTNDYIEQTPNIEDIIKSQISFIGYSVQTKKTLDDMGAQYKIDAGCKSCGGKISQIKLQTFEEVE